MKKILNSTSIFSTIIGNQKFNKDINYRIAYFVAVTEYDNNILLMNTLSRQMLSISKTEYCNILENKKNEFFSYLIEKYFLVPTDFNDFKFCQQVLDVAKTFNTEKALRKFVIMPTMDCNARCFYCFEHGAKRYPMEDKTAKDVADFIIKKSNGKSVKIQWFGGEPLYNDKAIDIISTSLIENDIQFTSIMISNGYLFNSDMILKAKEKWNLKSVQITLDGTEQIYNKTKNYIYKEDKNPFEKVINNIELLAINGINVIIRLNMDKHNEEDLYSLVDFLFERFSDYKNNISIYVWLLYDNRGIVKNIRDAEERYRLTDQLIALENHIENSGFALKSKPASHIEYRACLADTDSTTIILPNGNLGRCDHHSDDEIYGSIYSDKINYDVFNSWKIKREPVDLCKKCPLVPQCHKLKKCPDDGAYECDEFLQKQRLNTLYRQMRNAYKGYLEVNNNAL